MSSSVVIQVDAHEGHPQVVRVVSASARDAGLGTGRCRRKWCLVRTWLPLRRWATAPYFQ